MHFSGQLAARTHIHTETESALSVSLVSVSVCACTAEEECMYICKAYTEIVFLKPET